MRAHIGAALILTCTFCFTGCGQSAEQAYANTAATTVDQDMRAAMKTVTSLHVSTIYQEAGTPITMDASIDKDGNCQAATSMGDQTVSMVTTSDKKRYIKANAAYWMSAVGATADQAAVLADRWFVGLPPRIMASVCSLDAVVQPFTAATAASDKPTIHGTTTVAGLTAVNLQVTGAAGTATIAVSATAPHYPLTLKSNDGSRSEVLSQFNQPVKPVIPQGATDLSSVIK